MLLDNLSPEDDARLSEAIQDFTQHRMYVLEHIPIKYYLAESSDELDVMHRELSLHGCIRLDRDGVPVCLNGKQPVVKSTKNGEFHGPWRE